jgi:peptide/nickel transport system permease protein
VTGTAAGGLRLLAGRVVQAVLVAMVVGAASFLLVEALPGDQAYRIAAGRYGEDLVSTAAMR